MCLHLAKAALTTYIRTYHGQKKNCFYTREKEGKKRSRVLSEDIHIWLTFLFMKKKTQIETLSDTADVDVEISLDLLYVFLCMSFRLCTDRSIYWSNNQ